MGEMMSFEGELDGRLPKYRPFPSEAPRRLLSLGWNWQTLLPAAGVLIGCALSIGPFLATLVQSLVLWDGPLFHLTLANFAALLTSPRFFSAVGNTLLCGVAATLLSCVFGLGLAWITLRTDLPGRSWFETLNVVPFFLSPYVGALSWMYLLAPHSGLVQTTARDWFGISLDFLDIYGRGGVIWVLSLFYTPYIYLFVSGPMGQMDGSLEDSARVHGASLLSTLRHITLPLVMPALLAGAVIVFVTSAGLFDVPLALASPVRIRTVPTEIYAAVQYPADFGAAASYGVIIMAVTLILTLAQRAYLARHRYEIVSGKGYKPRLIHLRGVPRAFAMAAELFYVLCAVALPIVALMMVSVSPIWTGRLNPSFLSLENYRYILFSYPLTRDAISNSLILAVLTASAAVVVGVLQAYYLNRGKPHRRGLAEAVVSIPLGIPGIILGLGFLIIALRTPLYSTLSILLIAYVARSYPFATRAISSMFLAINPELEHSARVSGAGWWTTMRLIMLPLLRPAIAAAWLMLFVMTIRELGATILLYAQGTETISVALVLLAERGTGYVAALSMVQLVLLLAAFVVSRLLRASMAQS
ncbi:ABC transporter permease [Roseomonas elaeocarpi]|uniref:ABC transporter permease n=1 Tax=Roseomonas elaeocarpi TaxID=907779 RepID=A0ABV6JPV7_9PROT